MTCNSTGLTHVENAADSLHGGRFVDVRPNKVYCLLMIKKVGQVD